MTLDELQKAYTSYQQALQHVSNPKSPELWYGIGVLYDRYGSAEHARDAFEAVLAMNEPFEKVSEVRFRLAMLYKQSGAYAKALEQLRLVVESPPPPLTLSDVVLHAAHIEELRGEYAAANATYYRALQLEPNNPKTLQQFAVYW